MKSRVNTLNRLVAARRERVPRGQKLTEKFPVLDLGVRPAFHEKRWRFTVDGEVEEPLQVDLQGFVDLAPKWQQTSDFHCVTKWSRLDLVWSGISFSQIIAIVRPTDAAGFVVAHGADGYSTNLGLEDVMADDVLLAFELGGKPLPLEHGGPMRLLVPKRYAWKSAKFLRRIEFLAEDTPGYWEQRGYHNRGDPWQEERYG
ncbi:MAG: sulfite oxidase-like oxidoreductase [Candidatus Latescibacterota bacterium]|nr:sulfite oxidase-like oxidoreductase [Candidatus Latescibacterota bacterium]